MDEFWRLMATLAESLLFLMLGLSIAVDIFSDRYLAILIGIGAVILARIAGLALVMPLLARTNKALKKLPNHNILYFSNARGAVTIGLALSVPIELEYWWTIESIGFGVVLFSYYPSLLVEFWQQKKIKNKEKVSALIEWPGVPPETEPVQSHRKSHRHAWEKRPRYTKVLTGRRTGGHDTGDAQLNSETSRLGVWESSRLLPVEKLGEVFQIPIVVFFFPEPPDYRQFVNLSGCCRMRS